MHNDMTKRLPSVLAASDSGRIPGPVPPASNHQTSHLDLLVTTITSTTITSTHTAAASGDTSPLPGEHFAALLPGKRGCSCCGDGVSSLASPPGGLRGENFSVCRKSCVHVCVCYLVNT